MGNKYEFLKMQIMGAISIGAPTYNRGDIKGCEELYAKTYASLLRDPSVTSTPSLLSVLEAQRRVTKPGSHNENAWALRRGLDEALRMLDTLATTPNTQAPSPSAAQRGVQSKGVGQQESKTLLDFTNPRNVQAWYSLNDGVMGGRSGGAFNYDSERNCGSFSGFVRTENNGGFAGARCQVPPSIAAVAAKSNGIVLEVANTDSKAKTFELLLQDTDAAQKGVNFRVPFSLQPSNNFSRVRIPFSEFKRGTWRGRPVAANLRLSALSVIGFMILKPQVGPFQLLVKSIGVY